MQNLQEKLLDNLVTQQIINGMKTMGRVVGILKHNWNTQFRLLPLLCIAIFLGLFSSANAQGLVQVPTSILEKSAYGITLNYNGRVIQHRSNQGWSVNQPSWQAPYDQGSIVYVNEEALQYLGLNLPRLTNIRTSTSERFRIVFDLEERILIEEFSVEGTITAGRPLELNMPALAVPWGLTEQIEDISIQLASDVDKTRIRFVSQKTRDYKLFSLFEPRRLVIDFGPFGNAEQLAQQAPEQVANQNQAVNQAANQVVNQVGQAAQQTQQVASSNTQPVQQQAVVQPTIGVQGVVQQPLQPIAQQPIQQPTIGVAQQGVVQSGVTPPPVQPVQQVAQPTQPIGVAQQSTVQQSTAQQPTAPLAGIGQSLNSVLEIASDVASAAEQSIKDKRPVDEVLHNGVRYRRFPYSTAAGESIVHVVEITPGYGEFRVVGSLTTPRTISELANGAFVGINAGYFDPRTHTSIGLLKVAGAEIAQPTRNRASIGFGPGSVEIDRVLTQVSVSSQGRSITIEGYNTPAKSTVYTMPNARVGVPSQGVITVKDNVVIENKIGPRTIPFDGYAIVYDADVNDPNFRALAQLNTGDVIQAEFETNPKHLLALPYAVEAGPLLIQNGQRAYNPDFENFENAYILNGRTHQAAIGARADGTVLFVAAESMVAQELIPLFNFLGAESAMRLDSGSSTQLFVDGKLINKRSQRRVVSGIVYVPN